MGEIGLLILFYINININESTFPSCIFTKLLSDNVLPSCCWCHDLSLDLGTLLVTKSVGTSTKVLTVDWFCITYDCSPSRALHAGASNNFWSMNNKTIKSDLQSVKLCYFLLFPQAN